VPAEAETAAAAAATVAKAKANAAMSTASSLACGLNKSRQTEAGEKASSNNL